MQSLFSRSILVSLFTLSSYYADDGCVKKDCNIAKSLYPSDLFEKGCCIKKCCDPCINPARLYAGVDFLYWMPELDGLSIGSFVDEFTSLTATRVVFDPIVPKFKYTHGFRIYGGFQYPCNYWDLSINYLHLPLVSRSASRVATIQEQNVHVQAIFLNLVGFPIFTQFQNTPANAIKTKWGGNLTVADADLARQIPFCNRFLFTPHFGFRYMLCEQKLSIDATFESNPGPTYMKTVFIEDSEGYGIEGGFWADWNLGWGLSLFGHAGGSLISNNFCVKNDTQTAPSLTDPANFSIEGSYKFNSITPNLDYFAGIEFKFECPCVAFSAYAGWEGAVYFDMNKMATTGGNLTTQGLTLGATINL